MDYTQTLETEIIDELTGEIMELDESRHIAVEDLPKIVRVLRALEKKQNHIETYIKAEVQRLVETCNNDISKINEQQIRFEQIAESLLRQSGEKKLSYPGLGSVRFGMTRESVDTTGYDELSVDDQESFQHSHNALFQTTVKVTADKKVIKSKCALGDDFRWNDKTMFAIRPKQETFVFKSE